MGIEINMTPDDIDTMVKDTIMKSGFGKAVEEGIKRAMQPGYDNPVEKAMKAYVTEMVGLLLREKYSEQIRAGLIDMLEKSVTAEVMEKVTTAAVEKMVRAAQDY